MAIGYSTFTGTDLDQAFSARFAAELARMPSIKMLFNRNWESDARTNESVIIDNLDFAHDGTAASTIPVADRAQSKYKDAYQTPKEFNASQQSFEIDQGGENSFKLYTRQIARSRRGPGRVRGGIAKMQSNMMIACEDNLISYMNGLEAFTTTAPAAGDLPKADNTGDNGNAGKIRQVSVGSTGTNGEFLQWDTGVPSAKGNGSASDTIESMFEMLENLRLFLTEQNIIGGELIVGEVGAPVLAVSPKVLRGYITALRVSKLFSDSINVATYQSMAAFGSALSNDRLADLNIVAHKGLANLDPPASDKDAGFTAFLLTDQALTYAEDMPAFWSQSPRQSGGINDGPFNSYHQVYEWGRKLVNANQIVKVQFASDDA